MIVNPLFVFEDNSVDIFQNIDSLKRKLEPIDVKNNTYQVFDATGAILELSIINKKLSYLGIFESSVEMIEVANIYPNHQNEFFEKLKMVYLLYYQQDIGDMSLKQVQHSLLDLCGFTI